METDIRKKMEECRFFLAKILSSHGMEMDFYLSAYLNSAISVRELFNEQRHKKGCDEHFKKWYDSTCVEREREILFKFMRRLRNISHHERCLTRSAFVQFPISDHFENLSDGEGVPMAFDFANGTVTIGPTKNTPAVTVKLKHHNGAIASADCPEMNNFWANTNLNSRPITERLKEYQKKLEKIVISFEQSIMAKC